MNKITLLGRTTKEIELKYTQNEVSVAAFSLAVDRKFVKKGEERETDFINIVAFGNIAETLSKYAIKGIQLIIVGRLQTRNYEDKEGKKCYITEVIAEELYFTERKKQNNENESNMSLDLNIESNSDNLQF